MLAASLAGLCLLTFLRAAAPAHAQLPGASEATPDSVVQHLGLPEGHSPRGALHRALMVPGWGQYYNRQYWKVPVVVAGLGGVIYGLVYSWDRYFLYRNAWRFEQQPENYPQHEDARARLQGLVAAAGDPGIIKTRRNTFRRWREWAILGVGAFWIVQVADAYVSAHLLGFEINEELAVRVVPRREGLAAQFLLSF